MVTAAYELITPEIAASLLESSYLKECFLNKQVIQWFADDMSAGNWDENSAAIIVDEDGMLRDGRHRMAAIVRSKVAIRMCVLRNAPRDGEYHDNLKMY